MDQGISLNTISKQYHISKHTSSKVKRRKEELEFDTAKLESYSDTELGKLFFPNLYCKSQYKNVGLGQYKNVGFPTLLYCLF